MRGATGLGRRSLAIGAGVLVVVAASAGVAGYEVGLRAPRAGGLTSSVVSSTPTGTKGLVTPPPPSPVSTPPPPGFGSPAPSPPSNVPIARSNAAWAYDAATGRFVLFGGNTTTGNYNEFPQPLDETWSWDGTGWTRVTSLGPSGRFSAQVVYDSVRNVVVLHGGSTESGVLGDTWTWNGTRWLQMGPGQSPPPGDSNEPMAFDVAHGVTVLVVLPRSTFGPAPAQTWVWNGSDWAQLAAAGQLTGGTSFAAMAYDPGRRKIVYFSHLTSGQPDTWTFDGTSWAEMTTTSGTTAQTFAIAEDDATSNVVLYGATGDTWTWNGTQWMPANPTHSPGPRQGVGMTYDSVHHVVILFGGDSGQAALLQHHNDIWRWDGSDWTLVSGS